MADWTVKPIYDYEKPPGKINPPPPDQIQPTDPGWADWVRKETDETGLKWTPECSLAFEVRATGKTELRPIDGKKPDDYAADKDWGWKEDRLYETTPPEPYQDFTRWVRHYPLMRLQKCVQYRAQVIVRCGPHFVARAPTLFWIPDGAPIEQAADEYDWTRTSGMEKGPDGAEYKWQTAGKKTPPFWHRPEPLERDFSTPPPTPPHWLVHPEPFIIDWGFKPKWKLDWPGFKLQSPPGGYELPKELGKDFKWIKIKKIW